MRKGAISLTTETLVIIIAALVILIIAIVFVTGGFNEPLLQIAQMLQSLNLTITPPG